MRLKKIILLNVIAITCLPFFAFAMDIHLENNSDTYVTAQAGFSPCSSVAGDNIGIIKPRTKDGPGKLTVPERALYVFCLGYTCDAHIYASNNCSNEIAIVTASYSEGIKGIKNLDDKHYIASGSGGNGRLDQVSSGWIDWFKSMF